MLLAALLLRFFSLSPLRVESLYALKLFPIISGIQRFLFGWLPFSFGDLIYGGAFIWLILQLFKFFRMVFSRSRRQNAREILLRRALRTINFLLVLYIVFNLAWGLNYDRVGIAEQLKIETEHATVEDLKLINGLLLIKTNETKRMSLAAKKFSSDEALFQGVDSAYRKAGRSYPFLKVPKKFSLKSSMWSFVINAGGFSGYYNPFTGECQVNTTGPDFSWPFTALHEAAHSIGYAKESEANFAAFLAAAESPDPHFKYSAYADLFLYANRTLYSEDSAASRVYRNGLDSSVVNDFQARAKFNREKQNFIEPVLKLIYGKYLQSNSQPAGMLSYDKVTNFLIGYYKKFGRL